MARGTLSPVQFLASLLPGLRDFRTPFAVGSIWAAVVLFLVEPRLDDLQHWSAVKNIAAALNGLPSGVVLAVAAFAVYVCGTIVETIQQRLWAATFGRSDAVSWVRTSRVLKATPLRGLARALLDSTMRPNVAAERHIQSALRERMMGVPTVALRAFPINVVLDEFPLAAIRYSKQAPDQFQQYDRLGAEAQFRLNVAPSLLALFCCLGVALPRWPGVVVLCVGLLVSYLLLSEGVRLTHRADEMLASAVYFDYTSVPVLDGLQKQVEAARKIGGRASSAPQLLALVLNYLEDRELVEELQMYVSRLRHPSQQERSRILINSAAVAARDLRPDGFFNDYVQGLVRAGEITIGDGVDERTATPEQLPED